MKLLVLINGWSDRIISGGDYHILKMVRVWSKIHRIALVAPKIGYDAAEELLDPNYRFYVSSYEKNPSGLLELSWNYLKRILRTITIRIDDSPDVIISSSHLLYDVLPAIFIKRRYRSKWAVYVHLILSEFKTNRRGWWGRISILSEKISLNLCKKADLVFVINSNIRQRLIDMGYSPQRLFIVGNGLDHDVIDRVHAPDKKYEACYCGRLTKTKGIYDLIEIWQILLRKRSSYKLLVIGSGSEKTQLQYIIEQKGLKKNIILAGFVPENEKILNIKSSILFVYPSYEDTWGIVITEAMACGVPVVCYSLPAFEMFKDHVAMVPIGDKIGMAARIIELLGDKASSHRYSLSAKSFSKSLNWDKIASLEIGKIEKLLT